MLISALFLLDVSHTGAFYTDYRENLSSALFDISYVKSKRILSIPRLQVLVYEQPRWVNLAKNATPHIHTHEEDGAYKHVFSSRKNTS